MALLSLSSGYVAPHACVRAPCSRRIARRGAVCASVVRVEESVLDNPMFLDEAALLSSKGTRRRTHAVGTPPCTCRAHAAVHMQCTRRPRAAQTPCTCRPRAVHRLCDCAGRADQARQELPGVARR